MRRRRQGPALKGNPVWRPPPGFPARVPQRGSTFNERLAHAWADAGGVGGVQIGMDTPQVTAATLTGALALGSPERQAGRADARWWLVGVGAAVARRVVFDGVPMQPAPTPGRAKREQLRRLGYVIDDLASLIDVDHHVDAVAVADLAPHLRSTWRALGR